MGWNYLYIRKLQWLYCWSLGMDKEFHPTLYNGCNYLSMLGLKLNLISKRRPRTSGTIMLTSDSLSVAVYFLTVKTGGCFNIKMPSYQHRADSSFVPSQWQMALLCNAISHWLDAYLESTLQHKNSHYKDKYFIISIPVLRMSIIKIKWY